MRVVVLGAAGKAFCAGHDLKEMRAHDEHAYQQALFAKCRGVMSKLNHMPQPVIARVQGMATAGRLPIGRELRSRGGRDGGAFCGVGRARRVVLLDFRRWRSAAISRASARWKCC